MLSREDCELLRWLWRWKLLSTSAIQAGIYKTKTKNKTYRRLLHYQKLGLIAPFYSNCGKYCLWQLVDRGYRLLETFWSENYQGGFRSENKNHDFWVTVIHLGEWIEGFESHYRPGIPRNPVKQSQISGFLKIQVRVY